MWIFPILPEKNSKNIQKWNVTLKYGGDLHSSREGTLRDDLMSRLLDASTNSESWVLLGLGTHCPTQIPDFSIAGHVGPKKTPNFLRDGEVQKTHQTKISW